ncbi:MAG: polysaccharide deacetylase 2 family uncharacterized protein YibQ [bacterium]|jgi:polysaccharide deacetylase 2 family uncharacterized protein YibQ
MKKYSTQIIVTVLISFALLFIGLYVYMSQVPQFPLSVLSSNSRLSKHDLEKKRIFFQKYTNYLRENHGGLLFSRELPQATPKNQAYLAFQQQFRFVDQTRLFELTKQFAQQHQLLYKIRASSLDNSLLFPYRFEIDFLKDNYLWVSSKIASKQIVKKANLQTNQRLTQQNQKRKQQNQQNQKRKQQNQQNQKRKQQNQQNRNSKKGKLVIIIDDLGHQIHLLKKLLSIQQPINYAILPNLTYTRQTAELTRQRDLDIILHLPMEPKGFPKQDPGVGALFVKNSSEEIRRKVINNLSQVPYAIAVNNHMGSAFTQHALGMAIVMQILQARGLPFIDSKTAPGKITQREARQHQVRFLSRDVFLDNEQKDWLIKKQLYRAVQLAKRYGKAIAIGHPYRSTYRVLSRQLPKIEQKGEIRIIKLRELL